MLPCLPARLTLNSGSFVHYVDAMLVADTRKQNANSTIDMTNIDQFESVFKSADKPVFSLEEIHLRRVVAVTDLDASLTSTVCDRYRELLDGVEIDDWESLGRTETDSVVEMMGRLQQMSPDLICTYRNLHHPARDYPYSLGVHVDVMTQATDAPVLLLPHPESTSFQSLDGHAIRSVMAITDHLTGDHQLVNYARYFVPRDGTLWLTHMEDEATWERYLRAIERIPEIDTDIACQTISLQLLKQPRDYIQSCREVLQREGVLVRDVVGFGHHLSEYKRLIEELAVDLLVLHTKDEDQLAMHGLAYPLTVELREIPLLLL